MDDDLIRQLKHLIEHTRPDGSGRLKSRLYRQEQELDDAKNALNGLGYSGFSLSSGNDPPDCEAIVDGELWGIEVTELVHEPSMRNRIRGTEQRHYEWTDQELRDAVVRLIDEKDAKPFRGGPFSHKLLVIATREMHAEKARLDPILENVILPCSQLTDICVSYGYHSNAAGYTGPEYPATRIKISHR